MNTPSTLNTHSSASSIPPTPSLLALLLVWLSIVLIALGLLSACGGGSSNVAGGVGSGGTGVFAYVSEGTVSGFGSVIVDGVEFDDSAVPAQADEELGSSIALLKLGQRVRVEHSAANAATQVSVRAQLRGPVSRALDSTGSITVLGQNVRIVAAQDASLSNATVLDGITSSAGISAGDELEVHGSWVFDSARSAYVLVATRIEKTAATDRVLLSGVVSTAASSASPALRINSASGLRVQGIDAAIQQTIYAASTDQLLRIWAARANALAAVQSGSPVAATRVQNDSAANLALGTQTLRVSGVAGRYDPVARTVEVQGNIDMQPGSSSGNASGNTASSVSVRSTATGTNTGTSTGSGSSTVTSTSAALGTAVQIKGVTSGINWGAAVVNFKLRGTSVRASTSAIDSACRSIAAGSDMQVELTGTWLANDALVLASSVRCTAVATNAPGSNTLERSGLLKSFSATAQTLVLTTAQGDFSLVWDANSYFEAPLQNLLGLRVEVQAEVLKSSGQLRLRSLKRDN
jgi:hypothetical protein